jgi:hypothetical protein
LSADDATSAAIGRQEGTLDYERLDVYQCALQFAALAFQILEKMPSSPR